MIDQARTFDIKSDVRYRAVRDEGIVLRQSDAEIIGVNQLGVMVLKQVQQGQTVGEIVDAVCSSFDVDREQAERDIADYLDTLLESNVIEQSN